MVQQIEDLHVKSGQLNLEEVQTFLHGISYPATKREILDVTYDNGAPDHILEALNSIPDQEYYGDTDLLLTVEDVQSLNLVS